jgi:hypothetical protein
MLLFIELPAPKILVTKIVRNKGSRTHTRAQSLFAAKLISHLFESLILDFNLFDAFLIFLFDFLSLLPKLLAVTIQQR